MKKILLAFTTIGLVSFTELYADATITARIPQGGLTPNSCNFTLTPAPGEQADVISIDRSDTFEPQVVTIPTAKFANKNVLRYEAVIKRNSEQCLKSPVLVINGKTHSMSCSYDVCNFQ